MNSKNKIVLQQAIQAFQSGDYIEAERVLRDIVHANSKDVEANHLLAIVYAGQNNHKKAIQFYKATLMLKPNDDLVLSNYASSLSVVGQIQESLVVFNKALEINPHSSEHWYNLANTMYDLGRYEDAVFYYKQSIKLSPKHQYANNNYGLTLSALNRFSESLAYYDIALSINEAFPEGLINKGDALKKLKRYDEAIVCFDRALSLKPRYAEANYNKGNVFHELKRYDEAIFCFDQALSIKPDYAQAWSNKGVVLHELGNFDGAISHFDKALNIKPDYHDASWNKSLSLLIKGDFENGLPLYESRWDSEKVCEAAGKRFFDKPTWLGKESLQEKIILLHGEQGFGDFIQFCRYVKLVAELGAKVILEAPAPLVRLMENLHGVSQLVIKGEELPFFDYQCPLLSLPLAFNTSISSIPAMIPYLSVNPNKVEEWKLRLGKKAKQRIGLAWSSMSNFKNDSTRSLMLKDFIRALPSERFEYICVQKELKDCDRVLFDDYGKIRFFGDQLEDFADTAALIENLDLVLSTCTSVSHLSGALGKKTWILLSHSPDWRWLLGRQDSPWYPSMRLYRQASSGNWNDVMKKVKSDLNDRHF